MKYIVSIIAFLALACGAIYAREVPDATGYVTDLAGVLSSNEISQLDQKLREYDQQTTNQVVVLIVKSLDGQSIESFGIKVAEKWKAGQKGKDNGVILIIAKEERKTRIEVGYGLESVLTDLQCALILDKIVKPRFREGKYYDGIEEATKGIIQAISGKLIIPEGSQNSSESDSGSHVILIIIVIIGFGFPILAPILLYRYYAGKGLEGRRRWFGSLRGGSSGGYSSWGSGGGFSGGGGGFSGGGGSFGGGGASGGW